VKVLYESGARNFIFQNVRSSSCCQHLAMADYPRGSQMIPLELTILYAADSYPNKYWAFERNTTEWSIIMTEMTRSGNKLTQLMLQALAPTLPGAHIGWHRTNYCSEAIN
jgi:hypothetical protein